MQPDAIQPPTIRRGCFLDRFGIREAIRRVILIQGVWRGLVCHWQVRANS